MTPERLAEIRRYVPHDGVIRELVTHLDAVTAERDEARKAGMQEAATICDRRGSSLAEMISALPQANEARKCASAIRHAAGLETIVPFAVMSSDSAASNEERKPQPRCCGIVSFGVFCEHPKGHTGPCETGVFDA